MVSHQLTTPDDLGVTHEHSGQTNPRKPHDHRRFPERSDVLPTAWRWEGVPRMCHRLHHVPWLSTQAQGDLSRRWVLDAPLPLHACPLEWRHHLAAPVYEMQSRVHSPPTFRLALSPDVSEGSPSRVV